MMRRYVLVDVDHTMAQSWERDGILDDGGTWDDWNEHRSKDKIVHDIVTFINFIGLAGYKVIALTATNEKWRGVMQKWFLDNVVNVRGLLMRPDDDFRPDAECKLDLALNHFGGEEKLKSNVAFLVDDNDTVCQAFFALGITTLQVLARRD